MRRRGGRAAEERRGRRKGRAMILSEAEWRWMFDVLTKTWEAKGCPEYLAQENAAIELMWLFNIAAYVSRCARQETCR
jgi:hypothetical protein